MAEAVARAYFKLLAYKDEYEVARLYTDGTFLERLGERFEGDFKLDFHLAPPLIAARDPRTGHLKKRRYGPWMMTVFKILARLKGLRGTSLDPFGYQPERRMERRLIDEYEATVEELLAGLDADNHRLAIDIAALPETVRGFAHVKERNLRQARNREADLLAAFRGPEAEKNAA